MFKTATYSNSFHVWCGNMTRIVFGEQHDGTQYPITAVLLDHDGAEKLANLILEQLAIRRAQQDAFQAVDNVVQMKRED